MIEEQAAPTAEQLAQFDLTSLLERYPVLSAAIHADDIQFEHPDEAFKTGLGFIVRGVPHSA